MSIADLTLVSTTSSSNLSGEVSLSFSESHPLFSKKDKLITNYVSTKFTKLSTDIALYVMKISEEVSDIYSPQTLLSCPTFKEKLTETIGSFVFLGSQFVIYNQIAVNRRSFKVCDNEDKYVLNCTGCDNFHFEFHFKHCETIELSKIQSSNPNTYKAVVNKLIKTEVVNLNAFLYDPNSKTFLQKNGESSHTDYLFKGFKIVLETDFHKNLTRIDLKYKFYKPQTLLGIFYELVSKFGQEEGKLQFEKLVLNRRCYCHLDKTKFLIEHIDFTESAGTKQIQGQSAASAISKVYKTGNLLIESQFLVKCVFSKNSKYSIWKAPQFLTLNNYTFDDNSSRLDINRSPTANLILLRHFHQTLSENLVDTANLENKLYEVDAKVLHMPQIKVTKGKTFLNPSLQGRINMKDIKFGNRYKLSYWIFVFIQDEREYAKTFYKTLQTVAKDLEIEVDRPERISLSPDQIEDKQKLVKAVEEICSQPNKIVIFVTKRDEAYQYLKQSINKARFPCVSQFANLNKFFESKGKGNNKSDKMTSLLIQVLDKLGYVPWSVKGLFINIKEVPIMIVAYSVSYIEKNGKNYGFTTLAATFDKMTSTTTVYFESEHEYLRDYSPKVGILLLQVLSSLKKAELPLPKTIIIYREGKDKALNEKIMQSELIPLKSLVVSTYYTEKPLNFIYILVKENDNVNFFKSGVEASGQEIISNPQVGTIIDNFLIDREKQVFFLVSMNKSKNQLTQPTRYTVINDSNLEIEIIQELTFKLCFLYFNNPYSTRMPGILINIKRRADHIRTILKQMPAKEFRKRNFSA